MPANNCVRFDNEQGLSPCRPDSGESHPKESIPPGQFGVLGAPLTEHSKLMPEGEVFQGELMTALCGGEHCSHEALDYSKHGAGLCATLLVKAQ
jgi:hypothetical protein